MDELTIDDKKYISSKRAAQITGYAKDYIGQLCREGYVEAKRVGRSWYVLEAAIKDHRFGGEPRKEKELATPKDSSDFTIVRREEERPSSPAASMPRYEAMEPPSINLLRKEEPKATEAAPQGPAGTQDFHTAWQNWFDAFHTPPHEDFPADRAPQAQATTEPVYAPRFELPELRAAPKEEVAIPIHHLAPREAPYLPPTPAAPALEVRVEDAMHRPHAPTSRPVRGMRASRVIVTAVCLILCTSAAALAALGSGYFDNSLISLERAYGIDGISVINK
jgi:hypothetical protein